MHIDRRAFLKYCLGSAAALGFPLSVVSRLETAYAAGGTGLPKVVWLNGANCTGCTVSLANLISGQQPVDIADLLLNTIDLAFHPNLMGAAGDLAVQSLKAATQEDFVLVVDGGIPLAFDGHTCIVWSENGREITAKEAVRDLAAKSMATVCVGTCASFGGIPAGNPNPTQIVSVGQLTGLPTINVPGCPPHPDWIVWTIATLLAGVTPSLDERNRPVQLFTEEAIHKRCPRKESGETKLFGQSRCLKALGCKGPRTSADCGQRKWNNGTNWCIGANAICLGCTEYGFPDAFAPFYKVEYSYQNYVKPAPEDPGEESTPTPSPAVGLRISKAEYNRERRELKVEGAGPAGAIVKILDDGTRVLLGAVSVDREGKWRFITRDPRPVPTRARAECNGRATTAVVIRK